MSVRPLLALVFATSLSAMALPQAKAGPTTKPAAKSKVIDLDRTAGEHTVRAKVGDTLRFDILTGINASTGYHWIGPSLDGKVFGKVTTEIVRVKNYEKLKKEYMAKETIPGAPGPHLEDGHVKIKLKKAGTGKIVFRLGRTTMDEKPQEGDTICTYTVTVSK